MSTTVSTPPADAPAGSAALATAIPRCAPVGAHCTLGARCETPDGYCTCAGYRGGTPPPPNVDFSHWDCGRTRRRSDGCPDDIAASGPCTGTPALCPAAEGLCGPLFECKDGHWGGHRNTCSEIP